MASGIPVNPRVTSLTVVRRPSTAVTAPSTATTPPPMDKARFRKYLDYRRSLKFPPPERPLPDFIDERVNTLMTLAEITPQARAELAKEIAAEEQRRKDDEANRKRIIASIDGVLAKFAREHKEDALSVYEAYREEVKQLASQAAEAEKELKTVETIIEDLKK